MAKYTVARLRYRQPASPDTGPAGGRAVVRQRSDPVWEPEPGFGTFPTRQAAAVAFMRWLDPELNRPGVSDEFVMTHWRPWARQGSNKVVRIESEERRMDAHKLIEAVAAGTPAQQVVEAGPGSAQDVQLQLRDVVHNIETAIHYSQKLSSVPPQSGMDDSNEGATLDYLSQVHVCIEEVNQLIASTLSFLGVDPKVWQDKFKVVGRQAEALNHMIDSGALRTGKIAVSQVAAAGKHALGEALRNIRAGVGAVLGGSDTKHGLEAVVAGAKDIISAAEVIVDHPGYRQAATSARNAFALMGSPHIYGAYL